MGRASAKIVRESSFARALRSVRQARSTAQEEFDEVSGRTYISALERGLKQPTLSKVDQLAGVLRVHPLTILTLCYCRKFDHAAAADLHALILSEIDSLDLDASPERSK
jgi:transcriptional regulator with XRE-family HTH domain